jgi:hypothetical protein
VLACLWLGKYSWNSLGAVSKNRAKIEQLAGTHSVKRGRFSLENTDKTEKREKIEASKIEKK